MLHNIYPQYNLDRYSGILCQPEVSCHHCNSFFFCPQIVISDTEDLDPLETNPVTTPYRLVKDDSTPSQYLKFLFGHLGPKKWLNGWLN